MNIAQLSNSNYELHLQFENDVLDVAYQVRRSLEEALIGAENVLKVMEGDKDELILMLDNIVYFAGRIREALDATDVVTPDHYDDDTDDEPWCNHDAVAVVNGVCECGEHVG